MRNKRLCLASVIACVAATVAAPALAAGLGAGAGATVLGQPLDHVVPVRLAPGETLEPECISAQVRVGERPLPASQVRTRVEPRSPGGAHIRITTTSAMDEPVIAIDLDLRCPSRLSRNYIVLADPAAAATVANAAVVPAQVTAPVDADARVVASAARRSPAAAARRRASSRPASTRPVVNAPRRAPVRASAVPFLHTVAVVAPPAQLRLDFAAPAPEAADAAVERALEAVAQAASAARAQAEAASAAAARIAVLERDVERLRGESRTVRDEATQLRTQLAGSAGAGRWMLPLMALALLLAASTAWLAWRLARIRRDRRQDWREALRAPREASAAEPSRSRQATSPIPFVSSEVKPAAQPEGPRAMPPTAVDPVDEPALHRTEPLAAPSLLDGTTARDVSIEELIDLEQQADFFIVLGQDDAAVDLLVQHLRDTGGGSPLPYLKLLEIHHRRGERGAYERMRSRFNQRFNAYAPEWGVDLQAGRSLDDYSGVLPRLQQVWPRPLDAMAELEALLFRKSRGELFDLPAYGEVLFLYALARDRLDHDVVDPHNVDLLLPLADGGEFSSTAPTPLAGAKDDRFGGGEGDAATPRPATSVDLDLTQAARPVSIFDPLSSVPAGRRP